jgi:2,5-diamino-6-(ribosylamino)-4(3H)-pyrimidinone 5'-phosphate reductase
MDELHSTLSNLLAPYLATPHADDIPLVILTWAQSLDAKIAPASRSPLALSCLETKYMTHLLRRHLSAILIGAETAVQDNPSLNGVEGSDGRLIVARVPVGELDGEWIPAPMTEQPRPVILDPWCRARLPRLNSLVNMGMAKGPWIFCRQEDASRDDRHVPLKDKDGRFEWEEVLKTLRARGIRSVMIEGGASVINDVLSNGLADVVIVTIAPVFLGHDGIGIQARLDQHWLHDVQTLSAGKDIIIAGRPHKQRPKTAP